MMDVICLTKDLLSVPRTEFPSPLSRRHHSQSPARRQECRSPFCLRSCAPASLRKRRPDSHAICAVVGFRLPSPTNWKSSRSNTAMMNDISLRVLLWPEHGTPFPQVPRWLRIVQTRESSTHDLHIDGHCLRPQHHREFKSVLQHELEENRHGHMHALKNAASRLWSWHCDGEPVCSEESSESHVTERHESRRPSSSYTTGYTATETTEEKEWTPPQTPCRCQGPSHLK